ncbi:MAG: helix-turn-helix domain-containing protein [Lachnospiraceae bacterium]|nr:helix-turn-helix domain-containing protein [Lachnospiraceae bacterium]
MHESLLKKLSAVTEEEKCILAGERRIDRSLYMDGTRDVISGDKLLKSGQIITIRPHTRFVAFPEHTHDYVEMVYMCEGETRHEVNGTPLTLKKGELLMLGQHARQSIAAAGKEDVAVNFIVRPAFFSGTLSFLGEEETPLRRFVVSCLTGENEAGYLLFHVADVLPIQNLIENLLYTLTEEIPNRRGILQSTMGLLFAQLLNHTDALQFEDREQNAVLSVLRLIEEHYADGSLSALAEELHYELPSLSRLILKKTGRNYTGLLQEKRMSQAAWLLRNTDKKVDEISFSVGYENVSYFHRLFTARFGMSPKKYRDCK